LESNSLFDRKTKNKWKIVWKINEKYLSLQRQNISFDYAAECGEQGLIDTALFKSHLRVAFYFSCFFLKIFIEADCYILAFQ
jgi:hypothetical protein